MSTNKKNNFSSEEDKITSISSARKLLVVGIIVAIVFGIIYWAMDDDAATNTRGEVSTSTEEPQFQKDGVLYFTNQDTGDTLSRIAIEVADSEEERAQGLMNRSQMADSVGMLFMFEDAQPRAFWMKNTKIPLDILYVDENQEVVMIYKGVAPYSEQSVPSYKDAKYVVEVNGGYTSEHNIKEGDHIDFEIMQ